MTKIKCCVCGERAKWFQLTTMIRSIGWYYCKEHAKLEADFKRNDTYVTWTKVQRK